MQAGRKDGRNIYIMVNIILLRKHIGGKSVTSEVFGRVMIYLSTRQSRWSQQLQYWIGRGVLTLRQTGMCRPNGLLFHHKSLNMGPILLKKILRRGSHFDKNFEKIVKSAILRVENP